MRSSTQEMTKSKQPRPWAPVPLGRPGAQGAPAPGQAPGQPLHHLRSGPGPDAPAQVLAGLLGGAAGLGPSPCAHQGPALLPAESTPLHPPGHSGKLACPQLATWSAFHCPLLSGGGLVPGWGLGSWGGVVRVWGGDGVVGFGVRGWGGVLGVGVRALAPWNPEPRALNPKEGPVGPFAAEADLPGAPCPLLSSSRRRGEKIQLQAHTRLREYQARARACSVLCHRQVCHSSNLCAGWWSCPGLGSMQRRSRVVHLRPSRGRCAAFWSLVLPLASSARSCLLCCQPGPIPGSLAARESQPPPRVPCRLLAWPGRTIHMPRRTCCASAHSWAPTPKPQGHAPMVAAGPQVLFSPVPN